jgi:hypothetical protein
MNAAVNSRTFRLLITYQSSFDQRNRARASRARHALR